MCACDRCQELHGRLWCDLTFYEHCPYFMNPDADDIYIEDEEEEEE